MRRGTTVPEDTPWQSAGLDLEWTVTGLTNGQQYAFEVRALNAAGPGAAAGRAATPLGVPSLPESLTATAGDGKVILEWTEPADDGGSPVTGYEYRFTAGTAVPEDTPWQSVGLNLEWTISDLTNGREYAFEVRAVNEGGAGEAPRALATPAGAPGALASLTATPGDEEVALAWSAPADDGGSPVTGYEYRYAAGDGVPDGTPWQEAGMELGATVTGLGERDSLRVRGAGTEPRRPRGGGHDDGHAGSARGGAVQHGCGRDGRRAAGDRVAAERGLGARRSWLHRRDGQRGPGSDRGGGGEERRARPPPSGVRGWSGRGDSDGHGGLRRRASAGPGAERDARFRGTGGRRRKAAPMNSSRRHWLFR